MSADLVSTVCPYCALGCGMYIRVEGGRAVGIEYMADHPVNEGALCPKGNAALEILHHSDRLLHPLRREGDVWVQISWDQALDLVAGAIKQALQRGGPDSLGFLSSSKATNEANYLIQKLARVLGTNNVDNCARLCHAPSVFGLGRSLGTGAMTNPISDLENSRCIFVIGSNFAETHPIVARWVMRARDRGARVIVADPRKTPTSWMADLFLQIRPGSDLALLQAMMKVILDQGLMDHRFIAERTRGFQDLADSLRGFSLEWASDVTGVTVADIVRAAREYARSEASSIVYSMGITQHVCGTENVVACSDLAMICGHLGRPGAGLFPLRGQNNVQGACDMGALPRVYPGYRRTKHQNSVDTFRSGWNVSCLPAEGGFTANEMLDAALEGRISTMYVVGENPVSSEPHSGKTRRALEGLDFLAVQDLFMTETARLADVVLPAAAWAEKEGSFTSTERRVQWTSQAVMPPGEARSDLWIVSEVARRLGLDFNYSGPQEVLEEINRMVPSYAGITRERLSAVGGAIWPCPSPDHPGTPILHHDGFVTPDRRGRILPVTYTPPVDSLTDEYPLQLITGRLSLHHNTGSMTRRSPSLLSRVPDLDVEIHPEDARELQVEDGQMVVVSTRRGETRAQARLTPRVRKGTAFMSFHFPGTNLLTADALDPTSRIPELKASACKIVRW
ncbi:MAG: formate dehydrogenase subunit alpha [Methanosarcinales archaeon]|nr:formate dehydrogenase subunit alpha [Methanosarcinales archaeon]